MPRGRKTKTAKEEELKLRPIIEIDEDYRVIVSELCLTLQKKMIKQEDLEEMCIDTEEDKEDFASGWKPEGYYSDWGELLKSLIRKRVIKRIKGKPNSTVNIGEMMEVYSQAIKEVKDLVKKWA